MTNDHIWLYGFAFNSDNYSRILMEVIKTQETIKKRTLIHGFNHTWKILHFWPKKGVAHLTVDLRDFKTRRSGEHL